MDEFIGPVQRFLQWRDRLGSALGSVTPFWFEYFEGTSSGIMNLGDVNLGEVAAQIGSDLASGKISMDDVEERIEALCSQ